MIKIWGKTIKKNKIKKSHTVEHYGRFSEDVVMDGINTICVEFDIPRPIMLNKHTRDINDFLMVKFFAEDFIEEVDFDRLEVNVFIEKKKDGK